MHEGPGQLGAITGRPDLLRRNVGPLCEHCSVTDVGAFSREADSGASDPDVIVRAIRRTPEGIGVVDAQAPCNAHRAAPSCIPRLGDR